MTLQEIDAQLEQVTYELNRLMQEPHTEEVDKKILDKMIEYKELQRQASQLKADKRREQYQDLEEEAMRQKKLNKS